ncbi:MAG TPA: peroxiredoxin [Polyangiaceae bacterium]|jgi:peroxiredoxin Q/BCP|nr:peroxiredoxin [Polyangiaceae bacterium]
MAANKRKKKASKKAAKAAPKKVAKKAAKAAPQKKAKKAGKKAGKKAAKAAAPAAMTGKKARKSKRGKRARATGKSKQTSGEEEPAPVVDAATVSTLVGRGPSSSSQTPPPGAGSKAPDFDLPDQSGARVSSASLRGKPYVLYFYPKDNTSGCTVEACDFQAEIAQFSKIGVRVIGVSPDTSESHEKFGAKYGLKFTLLADTQRKLAESYGVWVLKKNYGKEYMGILRSTYLVNSKGVVQRAWRGVKVDGHVAAVAREAQQLQ